MSMSMSVPGVSGKKKTALVAALLFFIISHPMTYSLVDKLLGGIVGRVAGPSGCPTSWGLIVHSVVFAVAAYYLL